MRQFVFNYSKDDGFTETDETLPSAVLEEFEGMESYEIIDFLEDLGGKFATFTGLFDDDSNPKNGLISLVRLLSLEDLAYIMCRLELCESWEEIC